MSKEITDDHLDKVTDVLALCAEMHERAAGLARSAHDAVRRSQQAGDKPVQAVRAGIDAAMHFAIDDMTANLADLDAVLVVLKAFTDNCGK